MSKITPNSECIQYADDSALYRSCKVNDKNLCIKQLQNDITSLSKWSVENNLVFNPNKTKFMIFSSQQISKYHNLKDDNVDIKCDNTIIERVQQFKFLGVVFDEHLKLNLQLDRILKSSRSTLEILKKVKRYTPEKVRKQLVESLIFSNIDYCNSLYIDLPSYQKDRITKLQRACAGFVYKKYGTIEDVINLKWLLINERIDFSISKTILKGLLDEITPSYLQIKVQD